MEYLQNFPVEDSKQILLHFENIKKELEKMNRIQTGNPSANALDPIVEKINELERNVKKIKNQYLSGVILSFIESVEHNSTNESGEDEYMFKTLKAELFLYHLGIAIHKVQSFEKIYLLEMFDFVQGQSKKSTSQIVSQLEGLKSTLGGLERTQRGSPTKGQVEILLKQSSELRSLMNEDLHPFLSKTLDSFLKNFRKDALDASNSKDYYGDATKLVANYYFHLGETIEKVKSFEIEEISEMFKFMPSTSLEKNHVKKSLRFSGE